MMMFMALLILACIPLASGDKTELAPAVTPSMANLPVQVPLPFPSESSMAGLMPTNGTGAIEAIEKQMLQFIRNMRKTPAELLNGDKTFNFLQGDAHSTVNNSLIQGSKPFWPFWWYPFAATATPATGAATTDENKMKSLASMHNDYMAYSYIWMVMCFMIEQGLTAGGFVPKVPETTKQPPSAPGFPPYAAGAWPFGPYPGASAPNLEKNKLSAKKSAKVAHFHHKVSDPWDKDTEDNKDPEETVFLQKEAAVHPLYAPGTAPAMDLATIAKYFKAAGIYWDMIANLNIMACMGYLFPSAIKGLSQAQPSAQKYVAYVKFVAFYYWAGVQYWVDILNIYDIYTPADKKQVYGTWIDWSNKYALRCKSYAFYMYGYDNMFSAATQFKTPVSNQADPKVMLDHVKVLLHTRSQNLVMTVLSFLYQKEFNIPASGFYANSYSHPMVLEFAYDQLLLGYMEN
jgi:hypothetical protein